MPSAIALDGAGTAWVANGQVGGNLAQLSAGAGVLLSPMAGYGTLNAPTGVAVDPSGSVWIANSGDNSVSEFLGLATPTSTPLATNAGP